VSCGIIIMLILGEIIYKAGERRREVSMLRGMLPQWFTGSFGESGRGSGVGYWGGRG
jgi:hypothetical protein